jgi:hypothetical protein
MCTYRYPYQVPGSCNNVVIAPSLQMALHIDGRVYNSHYHMVRPHQLYHWYIHFFHYLKNDLKYKHSGATGKLASGRCQHRRHHGILRFQLDSDVCSADLHHNPRKHVACTRHSACIASLRTVSVVVRACGFHGRSSWLGTCCLAREYHGTRVPYWYVVHVYKYNIISKTT